MTARELQEAVLACCLELPQSGLVTLTWGNVSQYDPDNGWIAIKASGAAYGGMSADDITVVDLDGRRVAGDKAPSVDLPIHRMLYGGFDGVRGVVHTHSPFASAWAQSMGELPCLGTTHADYFRGAVPCTRPFTEDEIRGDYPAANGRVILEAFRDRDPMATPAVLMRSHGPFTWGESARRALQNAVVLEAVAKMAVLEHMITGGKNPPLSDALHRKHYECHFGPNAYYGQRDPTDGRT